jgi:hypothetical protein
MRIGTGGGPLLDRKRQSQYGSTVVYRMYITFVDDAGLGHSPRACALIEHVSSRAPRMPRSGVFLPHGLNLFCSELT